MPDLDPERQRLAESDAHTKYWKRWGPYLAERAWGTVREDYSSDGEVWRYFTHEQSRSRAYRWTEDGILGICDNHQRLCFALAFWNGKDPILKERLFGLTGLEGNHGEDVKEIYYYLDATPTNSYLKGLYKYPQSEFPYQQLVSENQRRTRLDPEYELEDTGIFNESRYFDITAEYAKRDVDDILIRITITNRGPEPASLTFLPTLWFRNTWTWYAKRDKPLLRATADSQLQADHPTLGTFFLSLEDSPELLFTENESNTELLWGSPRQNPFVKDGFNDYLIHGRKDAINPNRQGTKAAAVYRLNLNSGQQAVLQFRLYRSGAPDIDRASWPSVFEQRIREADEFYQSFEGDLTPETKKLQRQASAGLFWSKQFYHFVVEEWLKGDPTEPRPPGNRKRGRNAQWRHLFNEDVISMPDKWEYPWYAAWDLAFHTVAFAPADPDFSKSQLSLFLARMVLAPKRANSGL